MVQWGTRLHLPAKWLRGVDLLMVNRFIILSRLLQVSGY